MSALEAAERDSEVRAHARAVVVLTGDILTMPGLPLHPAAENVDVDTSTGLISGLF